MHPKCLSHIGGIIERCNINELIAGYCGLTHEHLMCLEKSLRNAKVSHIKETLNECGHFVLLARIIRRSGHCSVLILAVLLHTAVIDKTLSQA